MDPISNADRIALLLRQKLLERLRASPLRRGDRSSGSRQPSPFEGVQALAGVEGIDDHRLGRAFIQSLLADQFGYSLINEAKFQRVVDQVTETLEEDRDGSKLLSRAVMELRAAAR